MPEQTTPKAKGRTQTLDWLNDRIDNLEWNLTERDARIAKLEEELTQLGTDNGNLSDYAGKLEQQLAAAESRCEAYRLNAQELFERAERLEALATKLHLAPYPMSDDEFEAALE